MPTVVVTETLADRPAAWLAERADVVWCPLDRTDQLHRHLAQAEALLVRTYTQVDDALLDCAPKLKVVGRAGVGLDNIDVGACRGRGIEVVYTPDANTQAVVEYVIGLVLDELRPRTDLPTAAAGEIFHQMRKTEVGRQFDQLTLGIVGFGRIGKRLGRAAHALGVNVNVCDILPEVDLRKAVDFPFQFMGHGELYGKSDIVTVHVDGRAANRHLIDARALSHFRDDAMLINAARGSLVDAAALAAWAKAHRNGRAILDVHDPEPPPADYPLWGLPNVRLLPHLASRTEAALENMSWVVRDVAAVLDGRSPTYPAP